MLPNDAFAEYVAVGEFEPTTHGVGDGLIITAVIREVNKKYPNRKILVKSMSSEDIFINNPRIYKFERGYWPSINFFPHGRWRNKHQALNLFDTYGITSTDIRPEIFITEKEESVARKTLHLLSPDRPSIMFCRNSTVPERDWDDDKWFAVIEMLNKKYSVFQMEEAIRYDFDTGEPTRVMKTVPNARQELRGIPLRKAFALMSITKKYLGVNTGWMHAAAAFGYDNYVFLHRGIAGDPHWLYPENKNFFENEPLDFVLHKIKNDWMA